MAKPKPLFGKVIVSQVLKDDYIINWQNELIVKKEFDLMPSQVNIEKWKESISKVDIVNETNARNLKSAIVRGAVGSVALGNVGGLAGVMSAKSDTTFNTMITYNNDAVDLIECDIQLYTKLVQIANQNKKLDNEYEDVYYSEEDYNVILQEYGKQLQDTNPAFAIGCMLSIVGAFALIIWIIFFL